MNTTQRRPLGLPEALVVIAVAGVSFLFLAGAQFGANTSCTDHYSCTDSFCSPCRGLTLSLGASAALIGVAALVTLFLRRGSPLQRLAVFGGVELVALLVAFIALRPWI